MIGLATAAALFATPAFSQQVSRATQELTNRVFSDPSITTTTNCDNYMPNEYGASALCSVRKGQLLDAQGKTLQVQSRTLAKQEKNLDTEIAGSKDAAKCIGLISSEINEAKKGGPLSPEQKLKFKARIEACDRVS